MNLQGPSNFKAFVQTFSLPIPCWERPGAQECFPDSFKTMYGFRSQSLKVLRKEDVTLVRPSAHCKCVGTQKQVSKLVYSWMLRMLTRVRFSLTLGFSGLWEMLLSCEAAPDEVPERRARHQQHDLHPWQTCLHGCFRPDSSPSWWTLGRRPQPVPTWSLCREP